MDKLPDELRVRGKNEIACGCSGKYRYPSRYAGVNEKLLLWPMVHRVNDMQLMATLAVMHTARLRPSVAPRHIWRVPVPFCPFLGYTAKLASGEGWLAACSIKNISPSLLHARPSMKKVCPAMLAQRPFDLRGPLSMLVTMPNRYSSTG